MYVNEVEVTTGSHYSELISERRANNKNRQTEMAIINDILSFIGKQVSFTLTIDFIFQRNSLDELA